MRPTISDPGGFALKNAVRAAIVLPLAFWIGFKVAGLPQMALFGAFGSIGLLVFVDFAGTRTERLAAYGALTLACCATISLGTLCSHTTWLAVVAMALVGFAVLFAGVIDGYVAASSLVLILTFVIATMIQADVGEIPDRLAGWGTAALLSSVAIFGLWPSRPPDRLRAVTATALEALATVFEAIAETRRAGRLGTAEEERLAQFSVEAAAAVAAARRSFISMPHRPSGAGARTAALGRLNDDLDWLAALVREQPAPASVSSGFAPEREAVEASIPAALRAASERLRANDPGDGGTELRELEENHRAIGRAFLADLHEHRADDDAARVTAELDEAYRLRGLAFATLQTGRHAIQVTGGKGPPEPTLTPSRPALRQGRRIADSHASMGSVWLRNSVRGATGLALAVLVARVTDAQNGFWVVLGTISVLRSSALATGTTVVEALAGTLIGIVVGGAIVAAIGDHHGLLWAVLPFAVLFGAYSPRAISFTAGQAAFTIVIVVVFNLLNPVGWSVGVVRIEDVAIGCAISLLTGFLLWPRGAADVLRGALGSAFDTAALYLDQTIATMLGSSRAASIEPAAVEASEAALRLDETVREYLAERGSARRDLDSLARLVGGATRVRRIAKLMHEGAGVVALGPIDQGADWVEALCGPFDAEWQARRDWYEGFGRAIAAGEEPPAPEAKAPRPAAGPTSRLNRNLGPPVVLGDAPEGSDVPPGLAIAWAERQLGDLLGLEPSMSDAAHAVLDDFSPGVLGAPRQDRNAPPSPAAPPERVRT